MVLVLFIYFKRAKKTTTTSPSQYVQDYRDVLKQLGDFTPEFRLKDISRTTAWQTQPQQNHPLPLLTKTAVSHRRKFKLLGRSDPPGYVLQRRHASTTPPGRLLFVQIA